MKKRMIYICASMAGLFIFLNWFCPVKRFLGVECPTCGMSRALISLLRLDFRGYFHYNAMALPVALVLLLGMFHSKISDEFLKRISLLIIILVCVINLAYYIGRCRHLI